MYRTLQSKVRYFHVPPFSTPLRKQRLRGCLKLVQYCPAGKGFSGVKT